MQSCQISRMPFPKYLDCVPITLPSDQSLFHILSTSFFHMIFSSSFLTHTDLLSPLLNLLLRGMHLSWPWRKWCLNVNCVSWAPLHSRVLTHTPLKRTELALLKSRAAILLTALLLHWKMLNSIMSWSLLPKVLPTFTFQIRPSLFVNRGSICTCPLVGFSSVWGSYHQCTARVFWTEYACVAFPRYIRVTEVTHEYLSSLKFTWVHVNLSLPPTVCRRLHWHLLPGSVVCSGHSQQLHPCLHLNSYP